MYERKQDNQVLYVLPVEYILGKLPVVPVSDAGTIPYSMRQHAEDFVGIGGQIRSHFFKSLHKSAKCAFGRINEHFF